MEKVNAMDFKKGYREIKKEKREEMAKHMLAHQKREKHEKFKK